MVNILSVIDSRRSSSSCCSKLPKTCRDSPVVHHEIQVFQISNHHVFIVGLGEMPRSGEGELQNQLLGRHSLLRILDVDVEYVELMLTSPGRGKCWECSLLPPFHCWTRRRRPKWALARGGTQPSLLQVADVSICFWILVPWFSRFKFSSASRTTSMSQPGRFTKVTL